MSQEGEGLAVRNLPEAPTGLLPKTTPSKVAAGWEAQVAGCGRGWSQGSDLGLASWVSQGPV